MSSIEARSIDSALKFLIEESRVKGRDIVPLVGAGISIESGIPNLAMLSRYLAKVDHFVGNECYELNFESKTKRDEKGIKSRSTYEYLMEFGWPEPQDLDSDLWYWLEEKRNRVKGEASSGPVDTISSSGRTEKAGRQEPPKPGPYWLQESRHWMAMDLLVQEQILSTLKELDYGFFNELEKCINDPDPTSASSPLRSRFWNLTGGYWKQLLSRSTRNNPDLVDALFQKLTRRRQPGLAHRLFAFLAPVLRLRLFLTTNFDPLLEQALRMEGFSPVVFEVTERATLPHPTLLQEEISIIKLHGGAYGLRVERLDTPLDEETKQRFRHSLPKNPILLVMGLGGWDQRVLDMVELVQEGGGDVLWLHFEDLAPSTVTDRFSKQDTLEAPKTRLYTCHSRNPGGFLRELYQGYKNATPASLLPYRSQEGRPVLDLDQFGDGVQTGEVLKRIKDNESAGPVLTSLRLAHQIAELNKPIVAFVDHEEEIGIGCSIRLSEFVARKAATHFPVWVDLEVRSNSTEIVLDMLSQLRRYDPGIPPEIPPTEQATSDKLFKRIFNTLRRGRYIVAFNGVGSMGSEPTRHDRNDRRNDRRIRNHDRAGISQATRFLEQLVENAVMPQPSENEPALKDSILAFAVDGPLDSRLGTRFLGSLKKLCRQAYSTASTSPTLIWTEGPQIDTLPGVAAVDLVADGDPSRLFLTLSLRDLQFILILVAFRRRRSLVGLTYIASRLFNESDVKNMVERARKALLHPETPTEFAQEKKCAIIAMTEGGYVWMSRRIRNRVYHAAGRKYIVSLFQIHRQAANYFYDELFLASREPAALMEHFYHQIAALFFLNQFHQRKSKLAADPQWEVLSRELGFRTGNVEDLPGLLCFQIKQLQMLANALAESGQFLRASFAHSTLVHWTTFIENSELPLLIPNAEHPREARLIEQLHREIATHLLDIRSEALLGSRKCEGLALLAMDHIERVLEEIEPNPDRPLSRVQERLAAILSTGAGGHSESAAKLLESSLKFLIRAANSYRITGRYQESKQLIDPLIQALYDLPVLGKDGAEALAICHATRAEIILQELCFWKLKGDSTGSQIDHFEKLIIKHKTAADQAVQECNRALSLMAEVQEKNLALRSGIYSALGRARYLQLEFDHAYRAFDLSRAGLVSGGVAEREALAISLLRQCDCLLLHADDEVLRHFLRCLRRDRIEPALNEVISLARERIEDLVAADVLMEDVERARDICEGLSRENLIAPARSRLALAKDLLERAENTLEGSPRNVHWWSCLYQLRAQTEIERMLLLLTGDVRSPVPGGRTDSGQMVYQMQSSLRAALKAVRQGFDILLRSSNSSTEGPDFQVERFVRLWLQTFVCGAMLRPFRLLASSDWSEADEKGKRILMAGELRAGRWVGLESQWESWVRLNRRSGFLRLTRIAEIKDWLTTDTFLDELAAVGFNQVRGPGLVLRSIALKTMNILIEKFATLVTNAAYTAEPEVARAGEVATEPRP